MHYVFHINMLICLFFVTYRASVVPVLSFGENDLFTQPSNPSGSWLRSIQELIIKTVGFILPMFDGEGFLRLLPHRTPVTTVGKLLKSSSLPQPLCYVPGISGQFSVPQIEYPLGGSSQKCSHVYFLLQVFWVILLLL